MIHAGNFGDVIDVVNQHFERRTRNLRHPRPFHPVYLNVADRFALGLQGVNIFLDRSRLILRLRFHRFAIVLIKEAGEKVHLHDPTVLGDGAQHIIRHVARRIHQGARR